MKLKMEDVIFFIFVSLMIFIALWLLSGSPTLMSAIISVVIFAAGLDMLLWKKFFSLDKKVAIGFVKVRNDLDKLDNKLDNELKYIKDKLINIENLVNKGK